MNKYAPSKLLDSQYDSLFKAIISAGWNVKSDGHVEASAGFFALTEIPDNMPELEQMQEAVDNSATVDTDWPDAGWYVSTENSDGIIFVYEFPSKSAAEDAYEKLEADYTAWSDDNEDEVLEHRYNSAPYCAKCGGPCEMPNA